MNPLHTTLKTIFVISLFYFFTSTGATGNQIEIMSTGEFHGDEVSAIDGKEWFMLYKSKNKFFLQKTKINVDLFVDIIDNAGETTGKRITTKATGHAILLLKNIPDSNIGEIDTVISQELVFTDTNSATIEYGGDNYSISMQVKYPYVENTTAQLIFSNGKKKQILHEYRTYLENEVIHFGDDVAPTLIWAGDIDGDKKLDFLMNLTDHYNVSKLSLFLSSNATEAELVGNVADFRSVGC